MRTTLHQTGRDLLYAERGGWLHAALFWPLVIASLFYLAAIKLRNLLFDAGVRKAVRLPAKVVSVGNITVGGTGKTPWIILLAREIRARGLRVAVLSRGYKAGREGELSVVSDADGIRMSPAEAGDEPTLIARACPGVPVILGRSRAMSGKLAVERFGAEVLLLDDGFQHRFVSRDVDIVNFSTRVGMGTGMVLPAGVLREPPSAIGRAHAVVIHGEGERRAILAEYVARTHPDKRVFLSRMVYRGLAGIRTESRLEPSELNGKRVLAFCGIAVPDAMFDQLERLGAAVVSRAYPDHFPFDSREIERLQALAREKGVDYIVTSEKDAVKIDPRWISETGDLFFLEADVEIEGGTGPLMSWLTATLGI